MSLKLDDFPKALRIGVKIQKKMRCHHLVKFETHTYSSNSCPNTNLTLDSKKVNFRRLSKKNSHDAKKIPTDPREHTLFAPQSTHMKEFREINKWLRVWGMF